jgi:hypothetical protein
MKAVAISINFEEEAVMSTWFQGDEPVRSAHSFIEALKDDFPGWKHKVVPDAEAHNAQFLKNMDAFLSFEDEGDDETTN